MFSGTSNITNSVDGAFVFIIGISVVLLVLVTGVMIYFAVRYSHKRPHEVEEVEGNTMVEIVWTVIPTIIVLAMFWYGYTGFKLMRTVPEDTMLVKVTARMWSWMFEYENGATSAELVVPKGRAVKLAITATDVLHSLFIPAFRVKEDAVPGAQTVLWFIAEKEGVYDLFCTEYCGAGHSKMLSKVNVMEPADFDLWFAENAPGQKGSSRGLEIMESKGCLGCHSMDGSVVVGPTLKDIFGSERAVVTDGASRRAVADEEYLMKSIVDPGVDIAEGFPAIMPSGLLSDEEAREVIAYLKGQSGGDIIAQGEELLEQKGCLGCHSLDGSVIVGPTFKGLYGSKRVVITDGAERTIAVDGEYIIKSIISPNADVAKDYPAIMPPMGGAVDEAEAGLIVEYFKAAGAR